MTPASRAQRRRSSLATLNLVTDILMGKSTSSNPASRSPCVTSQAHFGQSDFDDVSLPTSPTLRSQRLERVTEIDDVINDEDNADRHHGQTDRSRASVGTLLDHSSLAEPRGLHRASLFSNISSYSQVHPDDSPPAIFTRGRRGACGASDTKECALVQSKLKKGSVKPYNM